MVDTEKLQRIMWNNVKYIFSKRDAYLKNLSCLYMLLLDHPFFIASVKKIRNKFGINPNGFMESRDAYHWIHDDRNRKHKFIKQSRELVLSFNIKPAFITDVIFFTEDYILCEKRVKRLLPRITKKKLTMKFPKDIGRKKISTRIINATTDREANKYLFTPEKTYIEVSSQTTIRDVDKAFNKITKRRNKQFRYVVEKSGLLAREIWHQSKNGIKHTDIHKNILEKYKKDINIENIAVYKKRYKSALDKLKEF